jgi:hypothetical protein
MDTSNLVSDNFQQQKGINRRSQSRQLVLQIIKENNWTSIKVLTDNQTAAFNINRKAAARSLIPSTRKFLEMIQKEGLQVKADYIPGEENQIADSLS